MKRVHSSQQLMHLFCNMVNADLEGFRTSSRNIYFEMRANSIRATRVLKTVFFSLMVHTIQWLEKLALQLDLLTEK